MLLQGNRRTSFIDLYVEYYGTRISVVEYFVTENPNYGVSSQIACG